MSEPSRGDAFRILFREFLAQFLTSESSVSDRQTQQAIAGVLAFVITPGLLVPFQMDWAFEFAAVRFPALLDPLTRLLASVFLTYSIVVIGVVAAYEWDALALDLRDAMVLGPLPISGSTIVLAKLAALGTLLVAAAAGINVVTALPFSLVAGSHGTFLATGRLFGAHIVATMTASTFVFCVLVAVRATLGMIGRGRIAVGTLLQFALVTTLLCFIVFVPTALRVEFARVGHGPAHPVAVHMQAIPRWSPTNWFVGLYEAVRGGPGATGDQALLAIGIALAALAAAVATTTIGYRHQLQRALAPSSSSGTVGGARVPRALARLLAGRRAQARAAADFIVATLARSRAQQAPIAMNAAIAAVMIVLDLSRSGGDVAAHLHATALASPIPLLLVFWLAVGLRASFFVPSELPSIWAFRITGAPADSFHPAIRGAMLAVLWPVGAVLALALAVAGGGWSAALRHAAFVALATVALVEAIAPTVPFVPFTRAYQPGHAKLKTRWPLYLIGAYLFGYASLRIERAWWSGPGSAVALLAGVAALALALERGSRSAATKRESTVSIDVGDDEGRIAVLDIGAVSRHADPR